MQTHVLPLTIATCLVGVLLISALLTMLCRCLIRRQKQRTEEDLTNDYMDRHPRKCVVKRGVVVSAAPTRQTSKRTTRIPSWYTNDWTLSNVRSSWTSRISEKNKSRTLHKRPLSPDKESLIPSSESKMKWLDKDEQPIRPPMLARIPSITSVDQRFLPGESKAVGQALSKSLATAYNGPPRLKGAAFFENQREILNKPLSWQTPPPRSRYSRERWSHSTAPARSAPMVNPTATDDNHDKRATISTIEVTELEMPKEEGEFPFGPKRNSWAITLPQDSSRKSERRNRKSLKVHTPAPSQPQAQRQIQTETLDIHERSFLDSASSLSLPQRNSTFSDHTTHSFASSEMSNYIVEDAQQVAFRSAVPPLPSHHLSLKNTLVSKYSPAWKGYSGDKAPFSPIVTAVGSTSSGSRSHVVSPMTPDFPR